MGIRVLGSKVFFLNVVLGFPWLVGNLAGGGGTVRVSKGLKEVIPPPPRNKMQQKTGLGTRVFRVTAPGSRSARVGHFGVEFGFGKRFSL